MITYEPVNSISYKILFVPSEDFDQPAHPSLTPTDILWAGTRKKGPYDFPVFGSSNAHAQFPIWTTDRRCFAWSFLTVSTSLLRTTKALAGLRVCAGSPEHLLAVYMISTLFRWHCACSYVVVSTLCDCQMQKCIFTIKQHNHILQTAITKSVLFV